MAGSVSTVVVAGPAGRVALRVPPSVTVADLLAEALGTVGGDLETTTRWLLARPKGDALDPEETIGRLGLADGTLLVIRPAVEAEDETLSEDLPEAVAGVVEAAPGQWTAADVAMLGALAAAAAVLASAASLWQLSTSLERVAVAVPAGLVALAFGAAASRTQSLSRVGRWVALSGLALWAVGGAGAVAESLPVAVPAAAALAVLAGALAIWFLVNDARNQACACALGAAIVGVGFAATVPVRASADVGAGIVVVLALMVVGMLPMVSVQMAGLLEIDSSAPDAKRRLVLSVASGRDVLGWLILGDAFVLVGASAVLAVGVGPYAPALAGVVTLATILQARHHGFRTEAAPLAVAAVTMAAVVEFGAVFHGIQTAWAPVVGAGMALLDVVVAVIVVEGAGRFSSSVDSRRWFGILEFLANAAIVPLFLGVIGLYDVVFTQAKHLL